MSNCNRLPHEIARKVLACKRHNRLILCEKSCRKRERLLAVYYHCKLQHLLNGAAQQCGRHNKNWHVVEHLAACQLLKLLGDQELLLLLKFDRRGEGRHLRTVHHGGSYQLNLLVTDRDHHCPLIALKYLRRGERLRSPLY